MPRGPLPNPNHRRRNEPTIPTTALPAGGRRAPAPAPGESGDFGEAGLAWWNWAWATPQASGWSAGDLYMIARRASLEDDLATIASVEGVDLLEALGTEVPAKFRQLVGRLAALATGRLPLFREMRELDDRLGLTPKGLAALRWTIVDDATPGEQAEERPLETFTVKELRKLVADRKIKTFGRLKKADLLALLDSAPAKVTSLDDRRARLTSNAS